MHREMDSDEDSDFDDYDVYCELASVLSVPDGMRPAVRPDSD